MDLYENIKNRRSVRTFIDKPLREDSERFVEGFLDSMKLLKGPFGHTINLRLIDINSRQKIGTYGIIKNPAKFVVGSVENTDKGLLDYGYLFEKMILAFNEKQLGTCWMAGTFKRDDLKVDLEGLIPAVTPIGHYDNSRFFENMMRKVVKSDLRQKFGDMFFDEDFKKSLTKEAAGDYYEVLEAVRLGPSASNKQPWRILLKDGGLHLYLEEDKNYNTKLSFKVQYLDIGIAMYHLEAMMKDKDLPGTWEVKQPDLASPNDNYIYIASYK